MTGLAGKSRHARLLASSALALVATAIGTIQPAKAQDATWVANPVNNDYGTSTNWSTGAVPGFGGTASFGASSTTNLSLTGLFRQVGGWTFNSGAPSYTFTNNTTGLEFYGAGISGSGATITNQGFLKFFNSSTAGSAVINNNVNLQFRDNSSAGSAVITSTGPNGRVYFSQTASGGSARFITNSGAEFDISGLTAAGTTAGSIEGAGTYRLGAKALTVGGNDLSTTVDGVIADGGQSGGTGGSLVKVGTGTLTLSGANSYSGGTTINAGAISVSADGNLGAATGGLAFAGGTLRFGASFDLAATRAVALNAGGGTFHTNGFDTTVSQNITGVGGLTKDGAGTMTLSGNNSYAGGTIIKGGTLLVSADNNLGATTGGLTFDGGTLKFGAGFNLASTRAITLNAGGGTFDSQFDAVVSQEISGSGALTKTGFGTLTLTGINSYTGGTTNNGLLQIGDSTHMGKILGAVTNNRTLELVNADTSGITSIANSGTIGFRNTSSAGSATITNVNFGATAFFDTSTAGNSTITGGNVTFQDTSNAGSATLNTSKGIAFLGGSSAANANITITGAGSVFFGDTSTAGNAIITFSGSNFTNFSDSSSAGNAHITNNRGMGFFGSATAGNAVITNASGADLIFSSSDGATAGNATIINSGTVNFFANTSGGSARLVANAGGVFDFSRLASSGTTAGSFEGAGRFYLGGKTLTVGGNNLSTTVSGIIADGGSTPFGGTGAALVKTGTGALTLAGTNTYTGATTVNDGALVVDGSIAASSGVTVDSGALLAGTGTIRNTTVNSGGALLGGNGTADTSLAISGNLAFQSGAFYLVQLDPATASSVNVTGTATLGGATVKANFAGGKYVARQYTIVTAGNVSGTFGSLAETNLPPNFHTTLSYDATHAYLNLILNFVPPPGSGLSGNQQNIGNAIINSFNANGGISLIYSGLTAAGLTQAAGETATGSQQTTFQAMGQFTGLLTDPVSASRETGGSGPPAFAAESDAASAYTARTPQDAYAMFTKASPVKTFERRWSVWAAGFGGSQTTDGNTALGSNSATSRLFGTAVGAEYHFSSQTLAGFAVAGGGTSFSVVNGGSGRSDLFQAGAYFRHVNGPAYVAAALAYGWQDITTDRTVTLAGIDRLHAQFNANAWSGRIEGGYRFVTPWLGGLGLAPYAAGQFTTFDLPAYAEQVLAGGNAFALAYGAQSVSNARSELGLRADKSWAMQGAILTLRGRLAWAHDFNPDRAAAATFLALPGASFVVNGVRPAADAALTTASAEMKWLNGWSAIGTFEGEFSSVTRSYAGKGTLRYAW